MFADFSLDPALLELRQRGRVIPLGRATLLVLERLLRERGGIVTQAELLLAGWSDVAVAEGSLRQAVCDLRRVLVGCQGSRPALQTIRGEGYRLNVDVAEHTPAAPDSTGPTLVGRVEELARLRALLATAHAGAGKTMLVSGPPGVGKTRLIQALIAQASEGLTGEGGATLRFDTLLARAEPDRGAPPLWPWTTLLGRCLAQLTPAFRARCEAAAPGLVRLLRTRTPGTSEYQALETPEQQRFLLFEELASTFARLSTERPLLIVFDDLHAADELSQSFFVRLAREVRLRRVLLVATVRPLKAPEQKRLARQLATIEHESRPEQLALDNLTESELAALFDGVHGERAAEDAVGRVFALTRGNPLFSLELMRLLLGESRARRVEALADGAVEVHAVIGRRLDQLSPAARSALCAAAVIGDEFALAELCGATGDSTSLLTEALQEACTAAMLIALPESSDTAVEREGTRCVDYRFAHPLLRQAAYHAIECEPLRALHRRFARWLEGRGAGVVSARVHELAHHYYSAGSEEDAERAARFLAEAARRASASTAFDAASLLYERALRMLALLSTPDPTRELALKLRYAEARRAAGVSTERVEALFRSAIEEARALGHRELFARAVLGYAGHSPERFAMTRLPNEFDPRERCLLEEAVDMLGTDHPELRALLLAGLALSGVYTRDRAEGRVLMAEALTLSRDAPSIRARVLSIQVFVEAHPGREREQSAAADELVELAARERLPTVRVDALVTRAIVHYSRGEGARSSADFREASRLADEVGGPECESRAGLAELFRCLFDGRLVAFEAQALRLLHAQQDPVRARATFMVRMLAVQYLRHGESTQTELSSFEGIFVGALTPSPSLRCALAMSYAARGERARAEREFDAVVANDLAALPRTPTFLSELTMLAVAACSLGDARRAAQLYTRLLPHADRMVVYGWEALPGGPVATALAMLAVTLGDLTSAEHWHERAIALCRKLDTPIYEQLSKSEYMRMLALRGTPDDLHKLTLYAHQLGSFARLHGIGLFEARAREAMRALERLALAPNGRGPAAASAQRALQG